MMTVVVVVVVVAVVAVVVVIAVVAVVVAVMRIFVGVVDNMRGGVGDKQQEVGGVVLWWCRAVLCAR